MFEQIYYLLIEDRIVAERESLAAINAVKANFQRWDAADGVTREYSIGKAQRFVGVVEMTMRKEGFSI